MLLVNGDGAKGDGIHVLLVNGDGGKGDGIHVLLVNGDGAKGDGIHVLRDPLSVTRCPRVWFETRCPRHACTLAPVTPPPGNDVQAAVNGQR